MTLKKMLPIFLSLAITGTMVAAFSFTANAETANTPANAASIQYSVFGQSYAWQSAVSGGVEAGTDGKGKRIEAIKINVGAETSGVSVIYQAYVQGIGWQTSAHDGAVAGTTGKGKRLEAIRITLSGADGYSVKYRVHVQKYGWMDWQKTNNGTSIDSAAIAGTMGKSLRIEAIEITLQKDAVSSSSSNVSSSSTASSSSPNYYTGSDEPKNPKDGDCWTKIDWNTGKVTIYKYSNGKWN